MACRTWPSQCQVNWSRTTAESARQDRCDIYDPPDPNTATRNSDGEYDRTFPSAWTKIGSNKKCRVNLSKWKGAERQGAGQGQATTYNDIEFDYDTVVNATSRIVITSSANNPLLPGQVFDVVDNSMESTPVGRLVQVEQRK